MGEPDFPMRLYAFLRVCARAIVALLFRFRVKGKENVPKDCGVIFAVNHISFWDPLFLAVSASDRHLTFMARSSLFTKPILGWCLKHVGAVPVDRGGSDFSALRTALSVLKDGKAIGIYPQGTRLPDQEPRGTKFESGAAFMAMTAGVPVIPIGVYTKNYRIRWFRRVSAVIGKPLVFERTRDRSVIEQNSEQLKERICSLCDEARTLQDQRNG